MTMTNSTQPDGAGSAARRNPASNLTQEDRIRGGRHSAQLQTRAASGKFAGRKGDGAASTHMGASGAGREAGAQR